MALTSPRTAGTGGDGEQARLERVLPFASLPTTAAPGASDAPLHFASVSSRPAQAVRRTMALISSRLTLVSPLPRPTPCSAGCLEQKSLGPHRLSEVLGEHG